MINFITFISRTTTSNLYIENYVSEAINNVHPKQYSLLGDKENEKYNCQDYITDVRREYNELLKNRNK